MNLMDANKLYITNVISLFFPSEGVNCPCEVNIYTNPRTRQWSSQNAPSTTWYLTNVSASSHWQNSYMTPQPSKKAHPHWILSPPTGGLTNFLDESLCFMDYVYMDKHAPRNLLPDLHISTSTNAIYFTTITLLIEHLTNHALTAWYLTVCCGI